MENSDANLQKISKLSDLLSGKKCSYSANATPLEDVYSRIRAAKLLGESKNKESIIHLANVLMDQNEDDEVRAESARALGELGFSEALSILESCYSDKEESVVENSIIASGCIIMLSFEKIKALASKNNITGRIARQVLQSLFEQLGRIV